MDHFDNACFHFQQNRFCIAAFYTTVLQDFQV